MKKKSLSQPDEIEIRAFGFIKEIFVERNWPSPLYIKLSQECSAVELAKRLELPIEKIETVVINGKAKPLKEGYIKPGDRVVFMPVIEEFLFKS